MSDGSRTTTNRSTTNTRSTSSGQSGHLGLERLKKRPSEYLREHAYWGFVEDRAGIRQRYEVGVDRMLWSTDFPHLVTRWPHSREYFEMQTEGVPEDEKHLLAAGNAVRFFGLG